MKVFYLCSSLERTGPTNQLFNIVSNLDPINFKAIVITLSPEGDKSFLHKYVENGVAVESLALSHRASIKELRLALLPLIEKYSPDIIHSQGIRSDKLMSTVKCKAKKVATLRNIPYKDYPMAYGWFLGRCMSYVHLKALSKLNKAVTVSYGVQKELEKNCNFDIRVIQNGADHHYFSSNALESEPLIALNKEYNFNDDDTILIYTGILEERKKLDLLYDLVDNCEHIKLLVVGGGNLQSNLEIHPAVKNKKIIMLGSVDDVRPYLAIADAFISLSAAEGLPNSMIEAMMMNLPVIASDIAPHAELIVDDNIPLKLFSLNEPQNIADFLTNQLTTWLDKSKGFEIREYTIKHFSASAMSNQYQDLYRELLNE